MNDTTKDILMHYGIPRRSGRYPWGSGEDPYQHGRDFLGRVEELKKNGWTETPENIKKEFGLTTTQYRTEKSICKDERRMRDVARAKSLKSDGLGNTEIGRKMGIPESTVRSLLDDGSEARMKQARHTADFLKKLVDEKGMIDVGTGVERELSSMLGYKVSKEKLNQALYMLEREGYGTYSGGIPQVTNPGQQTTQKVLCPPDIKPRDGAKAPKEIYEYDKIHSVADYTSHDGGQTIKIFVYPKSMDSKRLMIRYADDVGPDGARGIDKDGIVEIRRGVPDLSLGNSHYSQVRILVDDDRYIKGMAVYSDNMPDGVDVVFNTNKKSTMPKMDVLKKIKDDPDNPFGSLIGPKGQSYYIDKDGNEQLSLINKRADQGDWSDWKNAVPSQFLGKQSLALATKQLGLAKADKQAEFDELCALNNPTVKKHLLEKFASECDSAAVHLQAAALPGQKYHVIIPVNSLKDTEVYAPNYDNGTKLALIRYPHGGTFEIPILTVNNNHAAARSLLGPDVQDAVGINSKVAERLSGADFDGDTVMCIPTHNGKVKIASQDPLKGLEGFDPKTTYSYDKKTVDADGTEHYYRNGREFRIMRNTGNEMGRISNLITDMTLAGAKPEELARAVRHSMVVIDAEKHKLDYKQSEVDNNISALRAEYQRSVDANGNIHIGGASTILSRSKGETSVDKRQGTPKVNMINQKGKPWYDPSKPEGKLLDESKPEGSYLYKTADDLYYPDRSYDKKTGKVTLRTANGKKVTYDVSDAEAAARYSPVKVINDKTGEVSFTNSTGEITYKTRTRLDKSTRMYETDDAYSLVSEGRHPMEMAYADYANSMKALGNKARVEMMNTGKIAYSASAKQTYRAEVDSLESKLNAALLNASRERAAQRAANASVNAKKLENPDMKKEDIKKAGQQALSSNRTLLGSVSRRDRNIKITDREWEAIQAGAISENKLKQILNNTDTDSLRQRATPRATTTLSTAKIAKLKTMSASNKYSLAEMASALGVSTTTVSNYLKGENQDV